MSELPPATPRSMLFVFRDVLLGLPSASCLRTARLRVIQRRTISELFARSGKAGTVDRIDHLTAVGQKGATLAIAISAALWAHANIAYLAVSAFATLVFIEIGARGEVAKTFLGEIATNSLTESLSPGF